MRTTRLIAIATALGISFGAAATARAQDVSVGNIDIKQAWSRATPKGSQVGGGFLAVTNRGSTADRLVSGTTTIAGKVELHEMSMQDGIMKMRPLANGIAIEPGQTVTLAPGGLHIMFVGLTRPLSQGETFTAKLVFEKAGPADVTFTVQPVGAKQGPGGQPAGHGH